MSVERENRVVEVMSKLELVCEIIAPPETEEGREFKTPLTDDMRSGIMFILDEVRDVLKENITPFCHRCEERREQGEIKH